MEERVITMQMLEELLRGAEAAHAEYEKKLGHRDEDWPAWYAQWMFDQLPLSHHQHDLEEWGEIPSTEPFLHE